MPLNTIPNKGLTSRGYPSDRIADPIIINGDMSVSQRGYTSATAVASANTYYLDRYIGREVTDGALNIEQSTTAPSGFKNSLKITVTTADSSLSATQRAYLLTKIEGNRVAQLAFGTSDARKITLAFYIRASVTGTFSGSITNEAENRSFPFNYTINSADTWERKVVNIDADTSGTWDTDNTTGLEIYFSLGMGSTYSGTAGSWAGAQYFAATGASNLIATNGATWHLTGLQLEVGEFNSTTIPSFPFESYASNLKKCLRYCYKNTANGTNYKIFMLAQNEASTTFNSYMPFPEPMRASPSATFDGSFRIYDTGSRAISSQALSTVSSYELGIQGTMASSTSGYAGKYQSNNDNDAFILLDAEL